MSPGTSTVVDLPLTFKEKGMASTRHEKALGWRKFGGEGAQSTRLKATTFGLRLVVTWALPLRPCDLRLVYCGGAPGASAAPRKKFRPSFSVTLRPLAFDAPLLAL